MLPILSALLIVIGFLSIMSEALLSDSVQVSATDTARKIAGLIARDPIIKADLSNEVSFGIQERLLATLAADDLLSAVGVYGPSEEPNSNRLIHAELRHGDLACLMPATIEATARTLTHPTCDQQPDHPHNLILVTIAIDAKLGSDSLLDSSPDAGTADPDPGDLAAAPTLGSVRLAYSLRAVASMKSQYRNLILMVASVLVLFAGLTADRMARSMLAPIHRVNLALQEATEGNLKVHLEETTKDQLGAIAHSFNIMLRTLDANHEQIQSHNHTLEKRVEERTAELGRAYRELQSLDRLKDSLLSNVSHEMRTPLTSIVASVEILSDLTPQDEEARKEFLGIIRREAARLLQQINTILDMAKMEAEVPVLQPESADLQEIISRVIGCLSSRMQDQQVTVSWHQQNAPMVLDCDAKYISKVVASLLENAITFSPEGGVIDIHLQAVGGNISLEVTDDGPGVPKEKRDLLFTLFGQLSEGLTDKPKGLGIGLALSKRIAEAHGGDLRYIHRNKRGACFRLSLPMLIPTELARG